MKDIITALGKFGGDEWYNDITREMDKFNICYQRNKNDRKRMFWDTYIYDAEYYMNRGLEYFDQLMQKKVVDKHITLPLRVPGCTIGHIALNKYFIIEDIKFYENECYGKERCERRYTDDLKVDDFKKFIGMRIVLKK